MADAETLQDRVDELRGWALNRIHWCRREENKFGSSDTSIRAAQERITLMAVCKILGIRVPENDAPQPARPFPVEPRPYARDRSGTRTTRGDE